jgi:hypothetical protein
MTDRRAFSATNPRRWMLLTGGAFSVVVALGSVAASASWLLNVSGGAAAGAAAETLTAGPTPTSVTATKTGTNASTVTVTFLRAATSASSGSVSITSYFIRRIDANGVKQTDTSCTGSASTITCTETGVPDVPAGGTWSYEVLDRIGTSWVGPPGSHSATIAPHTVAPTVSGVTSTTANGTYGAATVIAVTVTFTSPVNVTGVPQLTLSTGSPAASAANYTGGSGTATLTFTYTVASGNTTPHLDYAATTALSLNGGTITDPYGNTATLTLAAPGAAGSLGAATFIVIDATPPTATVNQAAAQPDPTAASQINFAVVFSKSVTGFGPSNVALSGTAGATTATVTGSGTTYNVAVSGMTGSGTVIASVHANQVADAFGNRNTASTSTDNTVTYDATGPTVTINQASGQADPTGATPINFTVVFSAGVTGFGPANVALSGTAGATTATVTGSGTTYNVAVSGMTNDGTVIATAPADGVSVGGHPNRASTSTDNTVTWDTSMVIHVSAMTPSTSGTTKAWTGYVTISVLNSQGVAVTGVTVNGTWDSADDTFTTSCTTTATGTCLVEVGFSNNLGKHDASRKFTVSTIGKTGYAYNTAANFASPAAMTVLQP